MPKDELVPKRILLRASGRVPGVLRALTAWLVIMLVYGLLLGLIQKPVGLLAWSVVAGMAAPAVWAAVAFTAKLAAPVDVTATVNIRDSIAADRVSAVFIGLAVGVPWDYGIISKCI